MTTVEDEVRALLARMGSLPLPVLLELGYRVEKYLGDRGIAVRGVDLAGALALLGLAEMVNGVRPEGRRAAGSANAAFGVMPGAGCPARDGSEGDPA